MGTDAWPIALLALRIGAVLVLYLFLLSGFRALRAELVAPTLQLAPGRARGREAIGSRDVADLEDLEDVDGYEAVPVLDEAPSGPEIVRKPIPGRRLRQERGRRRRTVAGQRRIPLALGIPVAAAVLALTIGGGALFATTRDSGGERQGTVAAAPANQPFGPPAVKPATGRVTVGLAAQEDSLVRVTVDGVVQFDGTLKARQRQAWDGAQRIQVWTDKGKTVLIAINGTDLGPYSPAMGHPEWNRIDFFFGPTWTR
jgi:hypothetical protein